MTNIKYSLLAKKILFIKERSHGYVLIFIACLVVIFIGLMSSYSFAQYLWPFSWIFYNWIFYVFFSLNAYPRRKKIMKILLYAGTFTILIYLLSTFLYDQYSLPFLQYIIYPSGILSFIYYVLLMSYSFYAIISLILTEKHITPSTILASISAYLILGIIGGILFFFFISIAPNSFENTPANKHAYISAAMNYSFQTLTTAGETFLKPKMPIPKFFSILLSVSGVFYSAVIVGFIMGSYLNNKNKDGHS